MRNRLSSIEDYDPSEDCLTRSEYLKLRGREEEESCRSHPQNASETSSKTTPENVASSKPEPDSSVDP